ncbi:MAG: flagellar hook-length control protein FliK [Spirochaetes bacterium]|nr:flagellar hook-length control protein FliK [Spirochaetota bacterium]
MPVEIAVIKEFEPLDKKQENSGLNLKDIHSKKNKKPLSSDSLKSKDVQLFENVLSDKISEEKKIGKEKLPGDLTLDASVKEKIAKKDTNTVEGKDAAATAKKDANAAAEKEIKQNHAINDLLSLQAASAAVHENAEVRAEKSAIAEAAEKEIPEFSKNALSLLSEKTQKGKNVFSSPGYYSNQESDVKKSVSLKENNELKKEKKEFFQVVDLRRNTNARRTESLNTLSGREASEASQANKFTLTNNNATQDMSAKEFFPGSQAQFSPGKLQTDSGLMSRNGISSFQSQFLEYLKESGNTDIVKNANVILKDNKAGEIRLLMRPENLGYVRIKLMLNDNHIAGRIIVDNYNIKGIFESNIDSLVKSFKENGYSSATIDVSVGGEQNKERQIMENNRVLTLKEIKKVDEHTVVRNMLAENRLVDMVV